MRTGGDPGVRRGGNEGEEDPGVRRGGKEGAGEGKRGPIIIMVVA